MPPNGMRRPLVTDGAQGDRFHIHKVASPNYQISVALQTIRATLVGSNECTAKGFCVRAASPVLAMCRRLLAAGYHPALRLECFRDDMLALSIASIGQGARLEVNNRGSGFAASRGVRAAPPVRKSNSVRPRVSPVPQRGRVS